MDFVAGVSDEITPDTTPEEERKGRRGRRRDEGEEGKEKKEKKERKKLTFEKVGNRL